MSVREAFFAVLIAPSLAIIIYLHDSRELINKDFSVCARRCTAQTRL